MLGQGWAEIKLIQYSSCEISFLRATAVPPGTAEARISYGNSVRLSVCLSVCHDPVVYQAQVR